MGKRQSMWIVAGVVGLFAVATVCLGEAPALTCGLAFQDNAVLQQQIPLPVWGTTAPGAQVTVSFEKQTQSAKADEQGRWRVVLEPMAAEKLKSMHDAPPGQTMRIESVLGDQRAVKELHNLLVGEVWLCAGQSNMAGKLRTDHPQPLPDVAHNTPNYPAMRQMVSPDEGPWLVCTADTAKDFKKVCFYFARSTQHGAMVPVGIINAAVGGSKIETWLNEKPHETGGNYRKMIEPLIGYAIRGVVWYQGESNANDKRGYEAKLRSLIVGWRKVWNQPDASQTGGPRHDFSVYFVQLPGIGESAHDDPRCGDGRAEIREAQLHTLELPHTGMAVTIDIGAKREHPPNKFDTGVRLAALALHNDYQMKNVTPSGPLYKSFKIEGDAIRIQFDDAGNGLMFATKQGMQPPTLTPDTPTPWLSIQGKDGAWHWAVGRIVGSELIVSSPEVKNPVAVRYAYTNNPTGSLLYNKAGLPASPFTTCGYDPQDK